jgi:Fur family transcriptional regulator, ferric uptake regulator
MERVAQRALSAAQIEKALERFRECLRAAGQKRSLVREAIAREAPRGTGHFSIDELATRLRERGVDAAHAATVYRTVPLMVDAGLLQTALLSRSEEQRFEVSFEREHHDHLVCRSCGAVTEFHSEPLEALQVRIAEHFGFVVESHVHELIGLCKRCAGAEQRASRGATHAARPKARAGAH